MGLSRNKVAVSEGAAGSPPFYGEHEQGYRILCSLYRTQIDKPERIEKIVLKLFAVRFPGTASPEGKPFGGVAQLGEHLPCKQGVRGSIPLISTTR